MKYVLYVLLGIFLLSLLTGVTQVQPGERAVIWRFGRVVDEKPRPGLYIGYPWGIDRIERVPIELVRRVTVGYDQRQADADALAMPTGQLLTGDHNLVNIQVVLDYIVVENEVEQFVVHQDRVDALVNRAAEALLAEWIAGRTVDDVLLRGKRELPPWLVERTRERIQQYQLGIRIQDAYVTYLYPPADVKPKFDEVTRAQAEVQTEIFKAEQDANRWLRAAEAEKYRIESLTKAYRSELLLLATAEIENFEKRLEQYRAFQRRNPVLPRLAGRLAGLGTAGNGNGPLLQATVLAPGSTDTGQYLNALWWEDMTRLYARMREMGRIDVLDNYLNGEGLTITQVPTLPKKR